MKGSMWCHLSLSSGCKTTKQVCLKNFARLSPHVDASSSRCAVCRNSFVKEAAFSSDGRGPHRSVNQTVVISFIFLKANDCQVIILYFRNNLETQISLIFILKQTSVNVLHFDRVVSLFNLTPT